MTDPQDAAIVPFASTIQQRREEIRMELEIAGVSPDSIASVEKMVDALMLDSVIVTASELLRADAPVVAYALIDAQSRLLPKSRAEANDLLDRVSADIATRVAATQSYERVRKILSPPPVVQPMAVRKPVPLPPPPPPVAPPAVPTFWAVLRSAAPYRLTQVKSLFLILVALLLFLALLSFAFYSLRHSPSVPAAPISSRTTPLKAVPLKKR